MTSLRGMAADAAQAAGGAPATAPPPPPAVATHPLPFRLLPAGETEWDPSEASVALNVRLDGCIVPSEASAEGARIAYSHAGARPRVRRERRRRRRVVSLVLPVPRLCSRCVGCQASAGHRVAGSSDCRPCPALQL